MNSVHSRSEAFNVEARNVALFMPTNASSITVLNDITLGCRDSSMTLSIIFHSSLKNSNLGLLEDQNGSRSEQLGLSWQSQKAPIVSLRFVPKILLGNSTHCWLAYTNNANFRNDCPGSSEISAWALSITAGGLRGLCDAFFVTYSRWHTGTFVGLFVSKSRTLCHVINGCLGYPKNRIISIAEHIARRPSMIATLRLYSALGFNIAAILRT